MHRIAKVLLPIKFTEIQNFDFHSILGFITSKIKEIHLTHPYLTLILLCSSDQCAGEAQPSSPIQEEAYVVGL
jgi:hypothetical protein